VETRQKHINFKRRPTADNLENCSFVQWLFKKMAGLVWGAGRCFWNRERRKVHIVQAVFWVLQDLLVFRDVVAIGRKLNDQDDEFLEDKTITVIYKRDGRDWTSSEQLETSKNLIAPA
jgi:hypothetical protein